MSFTQSVWLSNTSPAAPSGTVHDRIVLSRDPLYNKSRTGSYARALTPSLCFGVSTSRPSIYDTRLFGLRGVAAAMPVRGRLLASGKHLELWRESLPQACHSTMSQHCPHPCHSKVARGTNQRLLKPRGFGRLLRRRRVLGVSFTSFSFLLFATRGCCELSRQNDWC